MCGIYSFLHFRPMRSFSLLREAPMPHGSTLSEKYGGEWQIFSDFPPRPSIGFGKPRTAGRRERVSDNALAVAVPAGYRDWRSVASLAIDAVSSAHSKRAYEKALKDFLAWYSAEARPGLSRAIVQQYRGVLESAGLAPPSINLRLSAIRKLAAEAAENDLLDRSVAQGIVSTQRRLPTRRQGKE